MSPELTAAVYGFLGGTLSSVAVLLLGRRLRTVGEVRFAPEDFRLYYMVYGRAGGKDGYFPRDLPHALSADFEEADYANAGGEVYYSFGAQLFNEKDVGVGIRDLNVVFYQKLGAVLEHRPEDASGLPDVEYGAVREAPGPPGGAGKRIGAVNLPPKELVSLRLRGVAAQGQLDRMILLRCDRAELRGEYLTGGTFVRTVAWKDPLGMWDAAEPEEPRPPAWRRLLRWVRARVGR
jgi:hypothetical protein